jgi:beta-N-acetylglucosaminidase
MNTYHLLWHPETNRLVIDDHIIDGYESQKTTRAVSWIDAKKRFSFELTPLQQEMLNAQNDRDKANRGVVKNIKDAMSKLRSSDRQLLDRSEVGGSSRERLQQMLRDEGVLQDLCPRSGPRSAEEGCFDR